jgi:dihydroorotate dehydrogenase
MKALYSLIRPWLFRMDSEEIHDLAMTVLRHPAAARSLELLHPGIAGMRPVTLWNLTFRNPVGLAAGFDKNGIALCAWHALNFGFVEAGTVTPRPQPGNPKPRIFRFPQHEAVVNAMGFPNEGVEALVTRLHAFPKRDGFPVGVNIGKNAATLLEDAASDYLACLRAAYDTADYLAVNVSSPNTQGLRTLQTRDALEALLRALSEERRTRAVRKPLLVKIAPDLEPADLTAVVEAVAAADFDGIIATNTTLDHAVLQLSQPLKGGLSGRPLRARSLAVLKHLARESQGRIPLIGVGGISTADDVKESLDAGASLVQIYTSFIYHGPDVVRQLLSAS